MGIFMGAMPAYSDRLVWGGHSPACLSGTWVRQFTRDTSKTPGPVAGYDARLALFPDPYVAHGKGPGKNRSVHRAQLPATGAGKGRAHPHFPQDGKIARARALTPGTNPHPVCRRRLK